MNLVRDCLDKQLVDRHGYHMGRVDSIAIRFEDGQQPRVAYIEVGGIAQATRLHRSLGELAKKMSRWIGLADREPYRIPWGKVVSAGTEVIAGVEAEETRALEVELYLRKKIISRIPGA